MTKKRKILTDREEKAKRKALHDLEFEFGHNIDTKIDVSIIETLYDYEKRNRPESNCEGYNLEYDETE